jgi:agmatine deiminase
MPAEWAPHRGTWLSWPHKEASWPGKFEPVPDIFCEIVRHLGRVEEVHINVAGTEMEAEVRRRLVSLAIPLNSVYFHHNPTNDAWCRDHGPMFIQRDGARGREQAIVDWGFNAWGG